ncbi:hypothetical protein [Rhizobium anhuiense]|uniref:hypothetical protein n=1 Tax=Rhizobium anhuiense TaxID=1184720 RepID=UPI0014418C66|nr:hypothetical protein [Rhizobium anhuiense]
MRPPAMFGSNGRNAKISRNFGEIPQDDNKMKRKSSRFGANRRKIIDLGAAFHFFLVPVPRVSGAPMNPPEFRGSSLSV